MNGFMRVLTVLRDGLLPILLMTYSLNATENSCSVYPTGVETVLPGLTPAAGQTMLYEFTAFYQADALLNSKGHSEVPGFHVGLEAVALKVAHNWGVKFLGGDLVSVAALPLEFESLTTPGGTFGNSGFGNPEIGLAYLAYHKGALHWWYGFDFYTPGFQYKKNDPLNIGQHNWATVPLGAISWLPGHGRTEVSSRLQYIVNYTDSATNYRSGNEFTWEFDGMHNITHNIAIGVNGYWYNQVTNDQLNIAMAGDGNRGRDVAIGPEIRAHLRHLALIAKYQKDTLVQNRPSGNMFWVQMGLPLGHGHEK
jgi:hypothetical protein